MKNVGVSLLKKERRNSSLGHYMTNRHNPKTRKTKTLSRLSRLVSDSYIRRGNKLAIDPYAYILVGKSTMKALILEVKLRFASFTKKKDKLVIFIKTFIHLYS
ncbi:hypothetical protein V6Z11_D03G002800 [Gossypium hirsutum]